MLCDSVRPAVAQIYKLQQQLQLKKLGEELGVDVMLEPLPHIFEELMVHALCREHQQLVTGFLVVLGKNAN